MKLNDSETDAIARRLERIERRLSALGSMAGIGMAAVAFYLVDSHYEPGLFGQPAWIVAGGILALAGLYCAWQSRPTAK